ncbi:MAG TPA: carboxypeptidase-like regulatory domain-containing protein, partial [Bacteroidales bacterium]|nr:carboxypeptidase-like regulatory domain-containing protein [Bacteroidales bacterium]
MKRLLLFMVILLTTSSFILAQNRIEGKVTDAKSGEALPGVTIYIKGTTIGTVSDVNGKYVLESAALKPQAVIVFSFVGYNTQEVVFQNQKVLDIKLE